MDDKGFLGLHLVGTNGALREGSALESSKTGSAKVEDDLHRQQSHHYAAQVGDESNYFKSAQW